MRGNLHLVLRKLLQFSLTGLQRVIPKSQLVTVYGVPFQEGNSVEIVRSLSDRYSGKVVWLCDNPTAYRCLNLNSNTIIVKKHSLRAFSYYLRSELVFFTHGLYGQVYPAPGQTFVNLWHGDGVKRKPTTEASLRPLFPANWVSGGTRRLTALKAKDFKLPSEQTLVYGNPRIQQFDDPIPLSFVRETDITVRPFVLWMPTFRKSSLTGIGYESTDSQLHLIASALVPLLDQAGYDLVIKPHRQDLESRMISGAMVVDDDLLLRHGTSLYSLVGKASALMTDFSSIWTDYLVLDRPIVFNIPDADMYISSRGIQPDNLLDFLPGNLMRQLDDIHVFVDEMTSTDSSSSTAHLRKAASVELGLIQATSPSDDLLDNLNERNLFRHGSLTAPSAPRQPIQIFSLQSA